MTTSVAPGLCCYVIFSGILLLLASFCWQVEPHQEVALDLGLEARLLRSLAEQEAESLPLLVQAQAWMEPSFRALPKTSKGRVGARAAAHLVHTFFNTNFGINLRGLQEGNPFNPDPAKALADLSLLQTRASKLSQAMATALPANYAYTLREVAAYAAVLQRLIMKEVRIAFKVAWRLRNHTANELLAPKELRRVLASAVVLVNDWDLVLLQSSTLKLGTDATMIRRFRLHEKAAAQNAESWRQLKKLVAETARHVLPAAESYSFKSALPAFLELVWAYGSFQNADCQDMQALMRSLDETGHGRVSLKAFYGVPEAAGNKFFFRESSQKLHGLGLLDMSQSVPSILVTNYVNGAHNCVAPNPHFAICCIDECAGLLRRVEAAVEAPAAPAAKLLSIAREIMPEHNFTTELADRLDGIAQMSGGQVQLHGRLFAQWLHLWQPYTCPYPHLPSVQIDQAQWKDKTHALSIKDKESYAKYFVDLADNSTENDPLGWWSNDEVLPLMEKEDAWSTSEKVIQYLFSFQFLAQLLIVISGMRDCILVVQESCPGRCRRKKNAWKETHAGAEPKQDQPDGDDRSKDHKDDKTSLELPGKGKTRKSKMGEPSEVSTGTDASSKRFRQQGGEASKQPSRKEGSKAKKRSKTMAKDVAKLQKGMHQAVDLAPAPLDAQKLDEVEHEHFAIAKIYADAFEETSVDLPEDPEGAASPGDAARVLLDADHANSTPPMPTHQAIYQWLEPQGNEETIAETIAETMVETIAEAPSKFGNLLPGNLDFPSPCRACAGYDCGVADPSQVELDDPALDPAGAATAEESLRAVYKVGSASEWLDAGASKFLEPEWERYHEDEVEDLMQGALAPSYRATTASHEATTARQGFRPPPGLEMLGPNGPTALRFSV